MNYLNRKNAESFRELGFDQPCVAYHSLTSCDRPCIDGRWMNYNSFPETISAPDLQTAADWIYEKYKVSIVFSHDYTAVIFEPSAEEVRFDKLSDADPHGRQFALAKSIEIIRFKNNFQKK